MCVIFLIWFVHGHIWMQSHVFLIQVCSDMVEGLFWRMWWYCKLIFEAINFCSRLLLWGSIFPLLFLKKTFQVELGKLFIEFHLLTIYCHAWIYILSVLYASVVLVLIRVRSIMYCSTIFWVFILLFFKFLFRNSSQFYFLWFSLNKKFYPWYL